MNPRFNIAGPCIPGRHYMLPPKRRLGPVLALIEGHSCFTLHAGRQTGKTTSARWLVEHYNAGDRFCALWVDVQDARELEPRAGAPGQASTRGGVLSRLAVWCHHGHAARGPAPAWHRS